MTRLSKILGFTGAICISLLALSGSLIALQGDIIFKDSFESN